MSSSLFIQRRTSESEQLEGRQTMSIGYPGDEKSLMHIIVGGACGAVRTRNGKRVIEKTYIRYVC